MYESIKKIYRKIKKLLLFILERIKIEKTIREYDMKLEWIMDTGKMRQYLPECRNDLIQKSILLSGDYYERSLLEKIKMIWIDKEKGLALDIGSNIGNHAIFFAKECGFPKVLAFEPIASTYETLVKNIGCNRLEAVVDTYNYAIGAMDGQASIKETVKNNSGATALKVDVEGGIKIISIDNMGLEEVSFVKIDTEGFEKQVLLGMQETIKKYQPMIWVEILEDAEESMFEYIDSINYKVALTFGCANYIIVPQDAEWKIN